MLAQEMRSHIEAAIVRLTARGGQGVVVEGKVILTAAHCINWSTDGDTTLEDELQVNIVTGVGAVVPTELIAVEGRSDIAALRPRCPGSFINQEHEDASNQFWEESPFVAVFSGSVEPLISLPIHILSHKGNWIDGNAKRVSESSSHQLYIETEQPVEDGTSGGPVVNNDGELVGVVSQAGILAGLIPRPHLCLPVWVWSLISASRD